MTKSRWQTNSGEGIIAILLLCLIAGGLYFFTGNGGEGNELPWKPAATNSDGKFQWMMWEMPSPVEFHSYDSCVQGLKSFISDPQKNYHHFRYPVACSYNSNSHFDAYVTNLFYDGKIFYCLSKYIPSSPDDKEPLYGMAIVWPGQPTSGDHWYCANRF